MRRFFRAQRDEDYSQIQYLTAKCTRLAHDKAVLDRDFLVSRERERKLQNDLEVLTARLLHQEQMNVELRMKQNQLIGRIHQQQDLVDLLQQRSAFLAQESCRDAELLRQVGSELLCLQSSEVKLEGLVEELHAEAQHRAAVAESLRAEQDAEAERRAALTESLHTELRSKKMELEKLQDINKAQTEELKDLHRAHQKEVRALQQENERSLGKLQETAEQFEWLCQQQRYWMCCVKRFKDCLMVEREALLQQVSKLQKRAEKLKRSSRGDSPARSLICPLQDAELCDRYESWVLSPQQRIPRSQPNPLVSSSGVSAWRADAGADLESDTLYEELFKQSGTPINGYQKPP